MNLENNLKAGKCVVVKDIENELYGRFIPIEIGCGFWAWSGWHSHPIQVDKSMSGNGVENPDSLDMNKLEIIDVYSLPHERFKVGDEVYVSENAREICEQRGFHGRPDIENIKGETGTIRGTDGSDYTVYFNCDFGCYILPHEALCYPYKEEELELVNIGGKMYRKEDVEARVDGLEEVPIKYGVVD